ncbi:hypothetical protein BJ508DRAFT_315497 [Ascobolus immersus RN42]|uniref:Uncharacterized protein n=1 Tax=Ascobolus immersus RN42 TaxID=1160509 RepID=A0A3N4HGU0_ASCIM|nr:hypothetical protein BJ508DRAFT_315497 [Ascobolus immersus RN42]
MYLKSKGLAEIVAGTELPPVVEPEWPDWVLMTLQQKGEWATVRGYDVVLDDDDGDIEYDSEELDLLEELYYKDQEKANKKREKMLEKLDDYNKRVAKARAILYRSVSKSLRPAITALDSPLRIFRFLRSEYGRINSTTNNLFRRHLDNKWKWGTDFNAWLADWTNTITTLGENGYVINDADLCDTLYECLPKEELAISLNNLEEKMDVNIYTINEFVHLVRTGVNKRILCHEAGETVFATMAQKPRPAFSDKST